MLRLDHLETLNVVMHHGSFATAAKELGYSASAVSQQITLLERQTGLVLFERRAKTINPTSVAHQLVNAARNLLAEAESLAAEIHRLAEGSSGRIRLGAFATAAERILPAALASFAVHHPGVDVTLTEGEPKALVEGLLDATIDVAVAYEYGMQPTELPSSVTRHRLLRERLLLIKPTAEVASHDLVSLASHRWITSNADAAGSQTLLQLCAASGFVPRITFRSNDYDVIRELVATTSGAAVIPALALRSDDRVTATPLPGAGVHRDVFMLHRTGDSNPVLGAFIDEVTQHLPRSEFVNTTI